MISRIEFIEKLNNSLSVEVSARDAYIEDLKLFSDKKILKELERIKEDEIKHIKIIENLIKMLKK